jgi:hypothetical protein
MLKKENIGLDYDLPIHSVVISYINNIYVNNLNYIFGYRLVIVNQL